MLDLAILAKDIITFLAPFMRYLVKAGEGFAEEAGRKISDQGWDKAKGLWARLQPELQARPATRELIGSLAKNPTDENSLTALAVQLKNVLAENESLARQVAMMHEEAKQTVTHVSAIGERSVAIGGNVTGSNIVTS